MTFQKGQSGNPGGRPTPARQELSALLDQVFTQPRRKKVLTKLVEDAERGDHDARTLLLAYTYGKPVERREISGPAEGPIEVRGIDYRSGLAALAPGPVDDSGPPGEA